MDMDIEDTPQCTADYLDLGGGQHERLCGLMLRNTKRKCWIVQYAYARLVAFNL